jgi:glutamyl-Q tRNA(Asp) synthetase
MGVSDSKTVNSHIPNKESNEDSNTTSDKDQTLKKTPPHFSADFHIGRFAPSPTGPLHFGSLIAATASYLCAKQDDSGKWLLRIEDVDRQREQAGSTLSIIKTLESYGFIWDDEIVYQSQRNKFYQEALESLKDHVYTCSCSRKDMREYYESHPDTQSDIDNSLGKYTSIYPGLCRDSINNPDSTNNSIRIRTNNKIICYQDLCQPEEFCQNIEKDVGDFILKRTDGLYAYQLAVVVDDALQKVNQVVRGADLFDNAPRQIYLQRLLGYPQPEYLHFPVAVTADGKKLSKQNLSPSITSRQKRATLIQTLEFLGQQPPSLDEFSNIEDIWQWSFRHWHIAKIPQIMTQQVDLT